jgi:phage baseplate assembly protein W
MANPQFIEYTQVITPENSPLTFPQNILRDLDLLYNLSSNEFEIRGIPVIENMIYNVCYTPIRSRWYEPEFGSNLLIIIHEPLTLETASILEIELYSALKRWVPYIALVIRNTRVVPYADQQTFIAYLNYVDIFSGRAHSLQVNLPRAYSQLR